MAKQTNKHTTTPDNLDSRLQMIVDRIAAKGANLVHEGSAVDQIKALIIDEGWRHDGLNYYGAGTFVTVDPTKPTTWDTGLE